MYNSEVFLKVNEDYVFPSELKTASENVLQVFLFTIRTII